MKFDIVSLGEPMYEFSQLPGRSREYLQGFGGDTMNCAVAAARQGARVAYLSRVGDDEFGRQFLDLWREEGIDTAGVGIDPAAHTAVYFITHGPGGHVFSYLRSGSAASRLTPAHLSREALCATRFVHTSGITQAISASACDAAFAAIDIAKAAGAQFVYDANLRPRLWPLPRARAIVGETAKLSDLFLLSLEDAEALCGRETPDAIVDWCLDLGVARVALKLGPEGVLAADRRERRLVGGFRVDAVDATGAGDCFAGALMARLADGEEFWPALRYANAAAALTCTGFGAVAPLPRPDAVRALMARHAEPVARA
jgi:2-dehydro-3-deoxygluconokinase